MSSKVDLHDELADLRSFFRPIAHADWNKERVTSFGKVVAKKGWLGRLVSCCEKYTFDIDKTLWHVQSVIQDGLPKARKIIQHSHECRELYPREDGTAICLQAGLLYREVRRAVEALNRHPEVTDKNRMNLQALGLGECTEKIVTFPVSKVLCEQRKKKSDLEPVISFAHEIEALSVRLQEEIGSLGFSLQQLVFFTPELGNQLPSWLKNLLGFSLPAIGMMHMINVLKRFDKDTGASSQQIAALQEALDTALILSALILEPSNARKMQLVQELERHLFDRLKQERLESLKPGDRLLIPAGFFNRNVYDLFSFSGNIGHLVMVELLKQQDGTFDLHCYDAGNAMHHETVTIEGQKRILPWTIRQVTQDKIAAPLFHSALAELAVGGINGNRSFDSRDLYSRLLFHLLPEYELKKMIFTHDAIVREQLFEEELQHLEAAINSLSVDELIKRMNTLPKQNTLRPEVVEDIFAGVGLQAGWSRVYIPKKEIYASSIASHTILSPCETLESAIKIEGLAHGAVFAIAHIDMVEREPQEGATASNYAQDILNGLQTLRQKEDGPPLVRVLRGVKKNGKLVYKSQNTPNQVACQFQGDIASCVFSNVLAWLSSTFNDMEPFMSHMLEEHVARLGQNLSQSVVNYYHPVCRFGWSDDLPLLRRLFIGAVGTLSDRLVVPIPISYVQIIRDKAHEYLARKVLP